MLMLNSEFAAFRVHRHPAASISFQVVAHGSRCDVSDFFRICGGLKRETQIQQKLLVRFALPPFRSVCVGAKPLDDLSAIVSPRCGAGQKPAVLAVPAPDSELHVKRYVLVHGPLPGPHGGFTIIGMKPIEPPVPEL